MKSHPAVHPSLLARAAIALLMLSAGSEAQAQIARQGQPQPARSKVAGLAPTVRLPAVDLRPFLEEDAQHIPGRPERFGAPAALDLSPFNSGAWSDLPDGDRLWRLRLNSPGALSISLIFDSFHLEPENELFIFNDDRSMVLGAFSEHNNQPDGVFAIQPVIGEAITLEFRQPKEGAVGVFRITQLIHGYRDVYSDATASATSSAGGSCSTTVDINCPQGAPYQDLKSSVAKLIMGGSICSGALIATTRAAQEPLFLTANHCYQASPSPSSWVVLFNYEAYSCSGSQFDSGDSMSGATLLSTSAESDYCLVRLNSNVPTSFHPFFPGWARTSATPTSTTGIHHPKGDVKKISHDDDAAAVWNGSTHYSSNAKMWRVGHLEYGATQGGSSGSPLFDQNQRIVGQLYGYLGSSQDCVTDNLIYGRLEHTWVSGANIYLDPDNLQYPTMNGYQGVAPNLHAVSISGPSTAQVGQSIVVARNVESNGWPYNGPFTYRIRLSTNSSITESDPLVFQATSSGYGSENCPAFSIPASIAPGTWYWGLEIVPVPEETQTVDNVVAGGTCTITSAPTDLVAVAVSGPANAVAGASVSLSRTITNTGTPFSGSFVIDYVLSADTVITTSDLVVKSITTSTFGTATDSFTLPTSTPDGVWYWGLRVHAIAGESSTSNNVKAGNSVEVSQPPHRFPLGCQVFGRISSATDVDRGRFFGLANMQFKIRAVPEFTSTSVSVEVRAVGDTSGIVLGILSPSSSAWLSASLTKTGEHELVVRPAAGIGDYTLRVDGGFDGVEDGLSRRLASSDGSAQSFRFSAAEFSRLDLVAKANKKLRGAGLRCELVSPSGVTLDLSTALAPVGQKGFRIEGFSLTEGGEYELRILGIKGRGKPAKLTFEVDQGLDDSAGTVAYPID